MRPSGFLPYAYLSGHYKNPIGSMRSKVMVRFGINVILCYSYYKPMKSYKLGNNTFVGLIQGGVIKTL